MSHASQTSEVPALVRDRAVHTWIAAKGVSDAGDAAWLVGVAWTAVQLADPAVAGLVVAAGTLPRATVLLFGGVMADRLDTFRILRGITLLRIAVLLATVAAIGTLGVSVPLLITVAVAFGTCDAVFEPSAATLGRQLVRVDDLAAYASMSQTVNRLGTLVGAAVGGGLVAAGGLTASALVNVATYVVVLVCVSVVLSVRFHIPRATSASVLRSLSAGFRHLRQEPATRTLVLTLSGLNLAVGPALGLGLALRVQEDQLGAANLGLLQALVGVGALAGALSLLRRRPRHEARTGFGLLLVQGLAIALLAAPGPVVAAAACLMIGTTAGAASVLLSAVFQRTVAPEFLGRLASMQRLGDDVLMPAAMAGFGALASGAGLGTAFVLFGSALTLLMVVVLSSRAASR